MDMKVGTAGLNTLQKKAYKEVLKGTSKIVVLAGAAGTGKSFTTSRIVTDYSGSVAITATTNKAKEVLANMAMTKAHTTHSFAGFTMVRQGKTQYLAPVRDSKYADLVIVEEMSMLPQSVWVTLQNQLTEGLIKKILLLGDPVQLPAIGITLDLKSIDYTLVELTQQMRQENNPTLNSYFASFRLAIETKDFKFDPLANLPDCIHLTESFSEFVKLYHKTPPVKKVIAYSNSVVDKYNSYINRGGFRQGDEVILDKPLGFGKNGDTVEVLQAVEYQSYWAIGLLVHGERFHVRHYLTKTALMAFLDEAKDDDDYWERSDQCFNLKHQYACTVHKSQGSSYNHVFVDLSDIKAQRDKRPTSHNNFAQPIANSTYLRLVYVALSRMRESATIYLGISRNYKLLKEGK